MSKRIIASALTGSRIGLFADLVQGLFYHVNFEPIMTYLVDICSSEALPLLAEQFNVEGIKGFDQCTSVEAQRELIKNAVGMQSRIGTVYGIRTACELAGYTFVLITKNVGNVWCAFSVTVSTTNADLKKTEAILLLRELILLYKSKRDILIDVIVN